MGVVDLFRRRIPGTRVVTKVIKRENVTNGLLDKIMVTQEAAAHLTTQVAIFRKHVLTTGSDRLMVIAELQVGTVRVV
jgi:hypothetical protein